MKRSGWGIGPSSESASALLVRRPEDRSLFFIVGQSSRYQSNLGRQKMPAHGRHLLGFESSYLPPLASASHFFMNEAFAAPARGLPFLPTAFSAQPEAAEAPPFASASHFFMNEALAAPARGLPSLPTALDAQPDAAAAGAAFDAAAGVAGVAGVAGDAGAAFDPAAGTAGVAGDAGAAFDAAAGAAFVGAAVVCANAALAANRVPRTQAINLDMGIVSAWLCVGQSASFIVARQGARRSCQRRLVANPS